MENNLDSIAAHLTSLSLMQVPDPRSGWAWQCTINISRYGECAFIQVIGPTPETSINVAVGQASAKLSGG